jgi:ABC-type branched-subunit amino acid transport system ATPase component
MILLDEPSLGLAPQLVEEIFTIESRPRRRRKISKPRQRRATVLTPSNKPICPF